METIQKYIKKNNIKSYLSIVLDMYNIIDMLSKEDKKDMEELEFEDNYNTVEESYVANLIENYNYQLACQNEDIQYLLELIYGCEFETEINKNGKIDLIDTQGAYLGGYNSYINFEDIISACNRLSGSYFEDYYNLYLY